MSGFIDGLNANSGLFNLLFGAIVAVATVFYARLTRALVEETRRMRAAQTDPHLTVQVEVSPVWISLLNVAIRNVGGGPAYDISLSLDRDLDLKDGAPLRDWGPFKHGLRYLAPGQSVVGFLGNIVGEMEEIEKPESRYAATVTAKYSTALGERREERFPLDFKQFVGLVSVGTPPDQEIAKAIKKLQEDLHQFATGWRKLKVDVFTQNERDAERRELEEMHARVKQERDEHKRPLSSPTAEPPGSGAT